MKKRISNHLLTLSVLMVMILSSNPILIQAQDRVPVRDYTNPDELVTISSATSFSQTFMILGSFSRTFQNKVLLNRSGKSGSIGFDIPNMHWRQALDYIANAHDLAILEQNDYIEIAPMPPSNQPTAASQAGNTGVPGTVAAPLANLETREIEISAIFFEGNRRDLREIGVDWTAFKDGVVTLANIGSSTVTEGIFQVQLANQTLENGWEFSAFMSTLELMNLGEILASPTIKVMDGKQGDIQVGQDISIKQRDFAGNVTDAFVQTGTILTVTPTIISQNDTSFIFLNINAERSTGQPDAVSTVINKQSANTQILLYSGESTIIAGLYETQESEVRRGIPILKDLPPWFFGLRYLFGFNSTDYQEKELVIVLKAEIVPSLRERFDAERRSREEILQEGRQQIRIQPIDNY